MTNKELPEWIKRELTPTIAKSMEDLFYKGDWCEQTAEMAQAMNDQEIMRKNYERAFESYLQGGWFKRALKVAEKLGEGEVDLVYQKYEQSLQQYSTELKGGKNKK